MKLPVMIFSVAMVMMVMVQSWVREQVREQSWH